MLVYNYEICAFQKDLIISNIALGNFTIAKINMKLNYILIKNT